MNTFHSRQTDCDRHARKNENTGTLNFTSQIAPSICTVMHTKRVKSDDALRYTQPQRLRVERGHLTVQVLEGHGTDDIRPVKQSFDARSARARSDR